MTVALQNSVDGVAFLIYGVRIAIHTGKVEIRPLSHTIHTHKNILDTLKA